METKRVIVLTAYGHDRTIDKIKASTFAVSENGSYASQDSDAQTYCDTINTLELKDDSWVAARIIPENTCYVLDTFVPVNFPEAVLKLDNIAVQKILREIDFQDLAKSLTNQDEIVREKIFSNMSKRAAQMLKEDMEVMRPAGITDVRETQEKILSMIFYLAQCGEIAIPYQKGETQNDQR